LAVYAGFTHMLGGDEPSLAKIVWNSRFLC